MVRTRTKSVTNVPAYYIFVRVFYNKKSFITLTKGFCGLRYVAGDNVKKSFYIFVQMGFSSDGNFWRTGKQSSGLTFVNMFPGLSCDRFWI
jgi:hypothetical protein